MKTARFRSPLLACLLSLGVPSPGSADHHHIFVPSRVRDRVVYEQDQIMPPNQGERVRLRVVCHTRDGQPLSTEVQQVAEINDGHISSLILEIPGQELTAASFHDMNADGICEVLLRFAPPMRQDHARVVLLSYSRRDRHYLRVWDQAGVDLGARWVLLNHERGGSEEWGLEVSSPGPSGVPAIRTYRYHAEQLRPL